MFGSHSAIQVFITPTEIMTGSTMFHYLGHLFWIPIILPLFYLILDVVCCIDLIQLENWFCVLFQAAKQQKVNIFKGVILFYTHCNIKISIPVSIPTGLLFWKTINQEIKNWMIVNLLSKKLRYLLQLSTWKKYVK